MASDGARQSVAEKAKKVKVTVDHHLEERSRRRKVEVGVDVAGARGQTAQSGKLNFDQLKAGGYIKQRQKDLFTVRCRCPGGRVEAGWLKRMGEVAERFGKGYVHLTFRQSVEIPYVHHKDFPEVVRMLDEAGARVASCGPRVRVPTACAGCEYNPNGLTDTQAMALLVNERFFGESANHKFKISFSGCPIDCARTNEMDLGFQGAVFPEWNPEPCTGCTICSQACQEGAITPHPETGKPIFDESKCLYCADCIRACPSDAWTEGKVGWVVRVGGRHGRHPHNGAIVGKFIGDEQIPSVIEAILTWYRQAGEGKGRTRIGDLLKRDGAMASLLEALEPVLGKKLARTGKKPEPILIHDYAETNGVPA